MKARTSAVFVACSAATLLLAGAGSSRALDLEGLTPMEELGALIFFDETPFDLKVDLEIIDRGFNPAFFGSGDASGCSHTDQGAWQ